MQTVKNQNSFPETFASQNIVFTPIEKVTRTHVRTDEAAYYLNRKPQTLRAWACFQVGLIHPIRINGRLAWPVAEIKKLLGVEV
ncbi:MAG: DNA-binding protein [Burkholderiales bacterium]|nr:DNA-binding protein [Burkholderiales bacterium]